MDNGKCFEPCAVCDHSDSLRNALCMLTGFTLELFARRFAKFASTTAGKV